MGRGQAYRENERRIRRDRGRRRTGGIRGNVKGTKEIREESNRILDAMGKEMNETRKKDKKRGKKVV